MADSLIIEGPAGETFTVAGARLNPGTAALSNGGFVNIWQESQGTAADVFAQIFDGSGATVGGTFRANTTATGEQSNPDVAGLTGGGFVVAYSNESAGGDLDIAFQRYDNSGTAVGSEITANTSTTGDQVEVKVVGLSGGGFAVAWASQINNGGGSWTTEVRLQRFDATGATVGSEILVNSETGGQVFSAPRIIYENIGLAELTGGNIAVSWDRFEFGNDASAQLGVIDTTGSVVAGPIAPEQTTDDLLTLPQVQVVALGNNTFMAVWVYSTNTTGSVGVGFGEIFGRIYDASGTAIGNEFAIATGLDNRRFLPFVESDGSGGALIGYAQESDAGGEGALLVQGVDQSGNLTGDPIWLDRHIDVFSSVGELNTLANGDILFTVMQASLGVIESQFSSRLLFNGNDPRIVTGNETIVLGNGGETVAAGPGNVAITGGNGNDRIAGGAGVDEISGGGGNDIINGGAGIDDLSGEDGDDFIVGGEGGDTISGGANDDVIDGDTGDDTLNGDGDADTIIGLDGNDTIIGGAGADTLSGQSGNDTIIINNGDLLAGNETIRGGDDTDTLSFQGGSGAVGHNLAGHTISGIEVLDFGTIAAGGDRFMTIADNSGIFTSPDGFTIDGHDVAGSTETLTLELVAGYILRGNTDFTFINFTNWGGQNEIVRINIKPVNAENEVTGTVVNDIVTMGNLADTANGDDGDDTINGLGGNDTLGGGNGVDMLLGGEGNDILDGGFGFDTLNGGGDEDTATYELSPNSVNVNLKTGVGVGAFANGDTLIDIENVIGSSVGDTLIGSDFANDLTGNDGNDRLFGLQGNDVLNGGAGRDRIEGGNGTDELIGGTGNDTLEGGGSGDILNGDIGFDLVRYLSSGAGVTVNLNTGTSSGGHAAGDSFISIENVTGSFLNDTLTGDNDRNELNGRNGNDKLNGLAGADILRGGGGQDVLSGGGGDDTLFGDGGNDIFEFGGNFGDDIISDFEDGLDRIRMFGFTAGDLTLATQGSDVLLTTTNGNSILFEDTALSELTGFGDFDFV